MKPHDWPLVSFSPENQYDRTLATRPNGHSPFLYLSPTIRYSSSKRSRCLRRIRDLIHVIAVDKSQPRFLPGQLVRHRRYGYRGVVVRMDRECQAGVDWYQSNQTQPNRNQPWYHVLIDGSDSITYAAETSLAMDVSGQPVNHPLVDTFFSKFTGTSYVRNDQPWPGDPDE